jgi:ABC-type taurine transport system ATPase subunit
LSQRPRDIRINGEPVTGVGKERGIVFQEPRLFPWLKVIDNVMLGLADEKLSRAAKRQRALEMLGACSSASSPTRCPRSFPAAWPSGWRLPVVWWPGRKF